MSATTANFLAVTSWQTCFRVGIAPQLSTRGLAALRKALEADDPRLVQGSTTTPPPLMSVEDWDCEAADAIGFACWQDPTRADKSVGDVAASFARVCFEADQALGEPARCRWFLNWWDDTPRPEAFPKLLAEVDQVLAERAAARALPAGQLMSTEDGDEYVATGQVDDAGEPLLVASACPADLRAEFMVPRDGIELRHGPLAYVGKTEEF